MNKLRRTKKASAARVDANLDARVDAILGARILADVTRLYFINNSKLPDTLADLAKKDARGRSYIEELPADPWGNAYKLFPGARSYQFEIRSAGPDGKHGTKDDLSNKSSTAL